MLAITSKNMRIIHIVGMSFSGKTTFIRKLEPLLLKYGRVATIKHLGHHTFELLEKKDTTIHFNAGAEISAGIDSEKTVLSLRSTDLNTLLAILADSGIDYVVIEGFKRYPFTSVIIGDLPQNRYNHPEPADVIEKLSEFDEYHTIKSLIRKIQSDSNLEFRIGYETKISDDEAILKDFSTGNKGVNKSFRMGVHIQKKYSDTPNTENKTLLIAIAAKDYEMAFDTMKQIIKNGKYLPKNGTVII